MLGFDKKFVRMMAVMHGAILLKAVLIFFGYKIGSLLDIYFGTRPILMVIGLFLGAMIGLGWVIFTIMRHGR